MNTTAKVAYGPYTFEMELPGENHPSGPWPDVREVD